MSICCVLHFLIVMLSVVMLIVIMLSVAMRNVVMMNAVMRGPLCGTTKASISMVLKAVEGIVQVGYRSSMQ